MDWMDYTSFGVQQLAIQLAILCFEILFQRNSVRVKLLSLQDVTISIRSVFLLSFGLVLVSVSWYTRA